MSVDLEPTLEVADSLLVDPFRRSLELLPLPSAAPPFMEPRRDEFSKPLAPSELRREGFCMCNGAVAGKLSSMDPGRLCGREDGVFGRGDSIALPGCDPSAG